MASKVTGTLTKAMQAPQSLARATGSNLYYSFIFLPKAKREAIKTIYGFCRIIDDIVDDTDSSYDRSAELENWRNEIEVCFEGRPATPFGDRLIDVIADFGLPKQAFLDLIDGMEMDLKWNNYETFADLREYCYRVASAVGLICIEIFGYESLGAREYAVNLGIALQLTNILRDLKEDVARGRTYIPLEDLERCGYTEQNLRSHLYNTPFVELMRFQYNRASSYFDRAAAALPSEDAGSLFAAEIMAAIYRELLNEIAAVKFDVYRNAVSLPKSRRLRIALGIWCRSKMGRWAPIKP